MVALQKCMTTIMVYFSYTVFDSSMEMKYWAFEVYPYYAFPFQVITPIIIWVLAEAKNKINSTEKEQGIF